jgi:TRAP-type mannitol/chloroaromatic compound transport system permease small subunit
MLDIVGGLFFLLPFIGLLAPGAWDLDVTSIVIPVPTK